ncbi:acyltransferase, partial [Pontibacter rugosus]
IIVVIKYLYYKIKGKAIVAHQNASIKGLKRITVDGILKVGVDYVGFSHRSDLTYLNINGHLEIKGNVSIGRGCRFDIGDQGLVKIGDGSYINPFTKVIIMHGLTIGTNCAVSWDCQFLDEDFHHLTYESKVDKDSPTIEIGNKVWIGSSVSIFKGTRVAHGCVVASNSVLKGNFPEENCLIAGSPARVIKRNVAW